MSSFELEDGRMRIELTETGGIGYFPGLRKPTILNVEQLDEAVATELRQLVAAAHFFDLPTELGTPARGAADYQHYILTIEENGKQHTVRALIPVENLALLALIQAVRQQIKAARAIKR